MYFIVIGKDGPDPKRRLDARGDHLEFVASRQHMIVYGGPLIDNGRMVGSLFIFEVSDRASLDSYMEADPYFTRGVFETVEVFESRWMVPEREAGLLAAETARARAATA